MLSELKDRLSRRTQKSPSITDKNLAKLARELVETKEDGQIKLYVIYRTLNVRRERKELFREGAYIPLEGLGNKKDHVCAFARKHNDQSVVVVVPRFLTRLTRTPDELPLGSQVWGDAFLIVPDEQVRQKYYSIFSGEIIETIEKNEKITLPLDMIFANFPVALLEQRD
jgi:(1->4)-alpha-D-glucan 1-alpha-D-glucosylmutase